MSENPWYNGRFDPLIFVICAIFFCAPLGVLIPIPGAPHSFRFYYLLLPVSLLLAGLRGTSRHAVARLILLSPIVVYLIFSLLLIASRGSVVPTADDGDEGNPVFRASLLLSLIGFYIVACDQIRRIGFQALATFTRLFFSGFAISLLAGYVFFIGYYVGVLSIDVLEPLHVLIQFGYGLLRFSPGSYPNEYGVICSYVVSIAALCHACKLSGEDRRMMLGPVARSGTCFSLFTLLSLGALFLATTRAAYVSFTLSVIYLLLFRLRGTGRLKFVFAIVAIGIAILTVTSLYFDAVSVFVDAYNAFFDEDSSAYERFYAWKDAFSLFDDYPILGTGFGSVDMIHNTYLQIFIGFGVIGTGCVVVSLMLVSFFEAARSSYIAVPTKLIDFTNGLRSIGMIHIAWFAMSNHNLNHFLTWFVLVTYTAGAGKRGKRLRDRESVSSPASEQEHPLTA